MWTYEHTLLSTAAPEAIWGLCADVEQWGTWNADIESIQVDGPFATGAQIVMTPAGQDPVRLRVAEATVNEGFVDEARIDGSSCAPRTDSIGTAVKPGSCTGWRSPARGPMRSVRGSARPSPPTGPTR